MVWQKQCVCMCVHGACVCVYVKDLICAIEILWSLISDLCAD